MVSETRSRMAWSDLVACDPWPPPVQFVRLRPQWEDEGGGKTSLPRLVNPPEGRQIRERLLLNHFALRKGASEGLHC